MKIVAAWDVTYFSLVDKYKFFEERSVPSFKVEIAEYVDSKNFQNLNTYLISWGYAVV
jgi:hypothetical protein